MTINVTQNFVFETDSLDSLGIILEAAITVLFKPNDSKYVQLAVSRRLPLCFVDGTTYHQGVKSKPLYVHVCTLLDYKSEVTEEDQLCNTTQEMLERALVNAQEADTAKLFAQCGDGYTNWFNQHDGSVEAGFRIAHRPLGGWNTLDLSLCHLYYGK